MEFARGHTRHAHTEQIELEQRWIESIAKGMKRKNPQLLLIYAAWMNLLQQQ